MSSSASPLPMEIQYAAGGGELRKVVKCGNGKETRTVLSKDPTLAPTQAWFGNFWAARRSVLTPSLISAGSGFCT